MEERMPAVVADYLDDSLRLRVVSNKRTYHHIQRTRASA